MTSLLTGAFFSALPLRACIRSDTVLSSSGLRGSGSVKLYAVSSRVSSHDQFRIAYAESPENGFRFATRETASSVCICLNKSHFRNGQHGCAFAAERLTDGNFGITCVCHPFGSACVLSHTTSFCNELGSSFVARDKAMFHLGSGTPKSTLV